MKIATVIGARPQFIKAAVVSRLLRSRPGVREVLIHTGQHYDHNMSEVFFRDLDIPKPDHQLGVGSGSHGEQTARMLEGLERVFLDLRPDWVLVYGDTNSTLAGALAAAKLHLPIAHVEAGLRSFNRRMPEEINRILTDHLADLLLAPTEAAMDNLRREGIPEPRLHRVGDVMCDAARYYAARRGPGVPILEQLGLPPQTYLLATIHRAENTDDSARLKEIFDGLAAVARDHPVVLPLHPRTRAALQRLGCPTDASPLRILEPVGYLDMVQLERQARLIVTDSGGVQKEAFFHGVPCVTLREETEWVELVESGWNQLLPPRQAQEISDGIRSALKFDPAERAAPDLYGGGRAGQRIVDLLRKAA
jgi:UDP-GlcNAc3NAcA epimerase